ncbi:MAG TPA: amino acid ABC transporter substrate-binding protein [Solirubrobacteraceae bacterium]
MVSSTGLPRRVVVLLAAAVMVLAVGCGASGGSSKSDSTNVDEIKIGATLPLTGSESRAGGLYRKGYELAIKQHNDGGGIQLKDKKVKVKLMLEDDRSDQRSVVSLTRKLISKDGADAMLATYSTSLVSAQVAIPESAGIPYVNGGGASTPIFLPDGKANKWVFGTISNIKLMSALTADWIAEAQDAGKLPKPLKVALLPENTAHGTDYAAGLREWIKKNPGRIRIVLDEKFDEGTADFTGLLGRVKAAKADGLMVDAHLPDFISMQRTYKTLGLKHKVLTYGARGSEADAKEALGSATDYIISAQWWSPQLESDASQKFIADFKAAYGTEPEWYSALAYDTANVLLEALAQAGSVDKEAVRAALEKMSYSPAVLPGGKITFPSDNGHQAENGFVVTQNLPAGKTAIIWPKEVSTAEGQVPGA